MSWDSSWILPGILQANSVSHPLLQEWVKGEKADVDFNNWFLSLTLSGFATCIGNNVFGHEVHGGWGFNRKHAVSTNPREEDPSFSRFYRQLSVRECWFPSGLSGADIFNNYGGQYGFPISDRVAEALSDLNDESLRVEPFFLKFNLVGIFGAMGSDVAAQQKTLLLAQALPVTTYSMGSNTLSDGGVELVPGFDMNANRPNNWPTGEGWHHSDIKDAAYLYTWAAFDKLANQGGLR